MDRLMNQVLGQQRASATMPMDLFRSGDHYVLSVDLPGADPGSIDVNVDDRTLTIRAQRTARTEDGVQWLAKERPVGTYARQLTVGRGLDLDAITASYADGVLSLTIPVAEEARPRRIEVTTGGTPATIEAVAVPGPCARRWRRQAVGTASDARTVRVAARTCWSDGVTSAYRRVFRPQSGLTQSCAGSTTRTASLRSSVTSASLGTRGEWMSYTPGPMPRG
jgi:HSP20 family protein